VGENDEDKGGANSSPNLGANGVGMNAMNLHKQLGMIIRVVLTIIYMIQMICA
jgi:hypothetical protein